MGNLKLIILLVCVLSVTAGAQNYNIDWYVIGSGGGEAASSNYQINGTAGQGVTGQSASSNYYLESGYWVGASGGGGGECEYVVGDANNSSSFNGLDVTYGVAYFKGGSPPPYECECTPGNIWFVAGDVNTSCSYNGLDITYSVSYFKGGPAPAPCGDCPPGGIILSNPGYMDFEVSTTNQNKTTKKKSEGIGK